MSRIFMVAMSVLLVLSSACSGETPTAANSDKREAVQVSKENIVKVEMGELVSGPVISGELEAERASTLRAKAAGTILQLNVEEGQHVERGALLGRIEARALADARESARQVLAAAQSTVTLARGEVTRSEELVAAGAIAQRELDQARANLAAAETQLANARVSLRNAEEALAETTLRAPFAGIVGRLQVHEGDVVQVGAELLTVFDPSSMRLVASVSSSEIAMIRTGQRVQFMVRGFTDSLNGVIDRIAPEADPVTRQVQVYVKIPKTPQPLTAGLFVDGRVVTDAASGVIVPNDAVNTQDGQPWVLRVRDGRTERLDVTIGLRDELTERVVVLGGLAGGDIVLRGAAQAMAPGTPVDLEG